MEEVKEDLIGQETLRRLSEADQYIRISSAEIGRHLRGKILELGSGTGNLTQHLAFDHEITALDINPDYLTNLRNKIKGLEKITGREAKPFNTFKADLTLAPGADLENRFDTILSCQVLEHLPNDEEVLRNYLKCLKTGGRVVLQLPAHPFAFSDLDKNLGHYRRYTRKSAEALLKNLNLKIKTSYYFNFFGLLGWVWAGKILGEQILPGKELSLFNIIVPVVIKFDHIFSKVLGLNIIVVGEKQ